jgi:hypothetical protein
MWKSHLMKLNEPPTLLVHKMLSFEPYSWFVKRSGKIFEGEYCKPVVMPVLRIYFEPRFARGTHDRHLNDDVVGPDTDFKWPEGFFQLPHEERMRTGMQLIDWDTKERLINDLLEPGRSHNPDPKQDDCANVARLVVHVRFWVSPCCDGDVPQYHRTEFHFQCRECDTEPRTIHEKCPSRRNEWSDLAFFRDTFGLDRVVQDAHGPRVAAIA